MCLTFTVSGVCVYTCVCVCVCVCVPVFSEVTLWIDHALLQGLMPVCGGGVTWVTKSLTTAEGKPVGGC